MTSRYVPNEIACPVPVELLADLLRSGEEQVARHAQALPIAQRAALAGFCFSRSHLRSLSFTVAAQCDVVSLRALTGMASEALIDQSRNRTAFDEGPKGFGRKHVSLARFAP